MSNAVNTDKLKGYLTRIENLQEQKKCIGDDIKIVKVEAERDGFSKAGIKLCLDARKLKPSQFREGEDLRDVYLHAIGMADEPALFKSIDAMAGDNLAQAELIERMKALVPTGGMLIVQQRDGPAIRLTRDKSGKVTAEEVKEEPPQPTTSSKLKPKAPERPRAAVPDCTLSEAVQMGRDAHQEDQPVTANPFPLEDKRQAKWEEGWMEAAGSDGMGPSQD